MRRSAGTLMKPFPQLFLSLHVCPRIMSAALIPVYHADGSLYAVVNEQRFERLQSVGLVARVVRSRKGQVKRAILFLRHGEPKPTSVSSVMGTRYSIKELLDHGPVWELKHLDGSRNGKNYAPPEMCGVFLQDA